MDYPERVGQPVCKVLSCYFVALDFSQIEEIHGFHFWYDKFQSGNLDLNFRISSVIRRSTFLPVNIDESDVSSVALYEDWTLQIWFHLQVSPP